MTRSRPTPAPLPLFLRADQLRAERLHRRRRLIRHGIAIGGLAALLTATIASPPRPLLLWNASASAPVGLYFVGSTGHLRTGDLAVARMPLGMRALAARRGYVPVAVPLVKRIAAGPGGRVCAIGRAIFIDGRSVAQRRATDGAGRAMPWWNGCITLRHGSVFLLMPDQPMSFEGRYFGPTRPSDLVGKAHPIWTR